MSNCKKCHFKPSAGNFGLFLPKNWVNRLIGSPASTNAAKLAEVSEFKFTCIDLGVELLEDKVTLSLFARIFQSSFALLLDPFFPYDSVLASEVL